MAIILRGRNIWVADPLILRQLLSRKMDFVQVIGLVAAFCTTISFLPQVIKTWRTGSAKDLSLGMFSFFCVGVALWLVYGILERDVPVIAANVLTLILASTLLFFKLRWK